MIPDRETNALYLSAKIQERRFFYGLLENCLVKNKIDFCLLKHTRDIWVRDFMPVQISSDRFVQFVYEPDYLEAPEYSDLKTNPILVVEGLGLNIAFSSLKLDGGNVIKSKNWVILTEKVFKENWQIPKWKIKKDLEDIFATKVIFIPQEPEDFTGHSDGILRCYDDDTVLVNEYRDSFNLGFRRKLFKVLKDEGIKTVPIPYNPYSNKTSESARGAYINFLEISDLIILPFFGLKDDDIALKAFERLYPSRRIEVIDCNDIAKDGGVLNCISWAIFKADIVCAKARSASH